MSNEGLDSAPIATGDGGLCLATWSRIESDAIVPMAAPNNIAKEMRPSLIVNTVGGQDHYFRQGRRFVKKHQKKYPAQPNQTQGNEPFLIAGRGCQERLNAKHLSGSDWVQAAGSNFAIQKRRLLSYLVHTANQISKVRRLRWFM